MRLQGYDYSLANAYFVTICTQDRVCSLAEATDGRMNLTPAGVIANDTWLSLQERFPFVSLDTFVVMPNHFHAILVLTDPSPLGRENAPKALGWVIRTFKAASTRLIRKLGVPNFAWQRDYYDHIVRSEAELQRIREYIEANPSQWTEDPQNVPSGERAPAHAEPWQI
jgi:REP element-mobilizing transposase RayT